jgi:hypothetical protein
MIGTFNYENKDAFKQDYDGILTAIKDFYERNGRNMEGNMKTDSLAYQKKAIEDRLNTIRERGKSTQGVVRKLERQLRNLASE